MRLSISLGPRSGIGVFDMELTLWPKQQEAYEFVIKRKNAALFCEQRTGKTFITMAVLRKLAGSAINLETGRGNDFAGVLVCLLNNRDSTWIDNLSKYLPWLNIHIDLDSFKAATCPKLLLVNFERLPRIIKKLTRYRKINWMGIDEAHRISKRGTRQSKAAARMHWVERKLILTGTPIEKQPLDLFAQFRFLDQGVFGTKWSDFESEYLDFPKLDMRGIPPGTRMWQQRMLQQRILKSRAQFKEDKIPQLIRLIKPVSFRLTKEDVGIVEPDVVKVTVPMLGRQRYYYDKMRKTSVIRLKDGSRSMAELEITNIAKSRQIASGFVYDDDGEVHYVGDAKLRKLMALIRKTPKPVVVFTAFIPDLSRIMEAVLEEGYEAIEVHGGVKKKLRPDIWRNFQRAQYDVIVCQIRTGGVGVDLWKSGNAIVHSMGHSFIDFDQAKSRMDNRNKRKAAKVQVLCCENTIDEDLYELVMVKGLSGEAVLSKLKRS